MKTPGTPRTLDLIRQQPERPPVSHADRAEVSAVERHNDIGFQALRQHRRRCVRASQREVAVTFHQLCYSWPIVHAGCFHFDGRQTAEKLCLNCRTEPAAYKIGHFRDDQGRNYKLQVGTLKHLKATLMVLIARINGRI